MGEPKRPVQGRSAVPEFNPTEFALHHGSIAGRQISDLGTGNNTAEATPEAIHRLIGMLSSIRGDADGDAAVVTPVQRNLFTRLMATLDDQRDHHAVDLPRGDSMPAVGKLDDGIAADDPADDARVQNAALQQRVAALRERAIAMRNERTREQERQLLDEARQQAEGEAQLILRDERSAVSDERVQLVTELSAAFAQFDEIEQLDPRETASWTDEEIEAYYTSFGAERPTHDGDDAADDARDEWIAARTAEIFNARLAEERAITSQSMQRARGDTNPSVS